MDGNTARNIYNADNNNKYCVSSWFQAFAVFCMLYAFFWVITQKEAYNIV